MKTCVSQLALGVVLFCTLPASLLPLPARAAAAERNELRSKPIRTVLREPLPPEELKLTQTSRAWEIAGPAFTYHVQLETGTITALHAVREGDAVLTANAPADIRIDDDALSSGANAVKITVLSQAKNQIVVQVEGIWRDPAKRKPDMNFTLHHTFFNDGVVVTKVILIPQSDLLVEKAIVSCFSGEGQFTHYLHKRLDEHGDAAQRGPLPDAGSALRISQPTSCLQIFSPTAAVAIFTDAGGTHLSQTNLTTALLEVQRKEANTAGVSLTQYLVHVAPGDQPFRLKAGAAFNFRTGISVAPNRRPHPRMHDLRMFTWIGDVKFPYPSDAEIGEVARLGFTVFQMHRLGTPGEPRPPEGELARVLKKVHEYGMLFVWEENADLLFANAPGVLELKTRNAWPRWQGFNYNGRYTDTMDPVCDLIATCLASPNGLAEYRLANIGRMLERFDVDGIYLDNNLPYPNCTLWREHGHPRPLYDCLIELHEMNWRRRELLRKRRPHTVLISHNSRGIILPTMCDFDVSLYGEGYSFASAEDYWNYFRQVSNLPAQGMIWPGSYEPNRCAASLAYNLDLLTGGGQYSQTDWRMYPQKFSYATGVNDLEKLYVQTYNRAQFYFGLYESTPHLFATSSNFFRTTTPHTYASVYHNRVWDDWLIPIVNMSATPRTTALEIRAPQALGLAPNADYLLFDLQQRTATTLQASELNRAFAGIRVAGQNLRLFLLQQRPAEEPFHVWGGKRMAETWSPKARELTLKLDGPDGQQDTVYVGGARRGIERVLVAGKPAEFGFDSAQGLAHGVVSFAREPVTVEVQYSSDGANWLPEKKVVPDALAQRFQAP